MNDTDTPLIWTTRGNLPVDQLRLEVRWIDNADYTQMVETYTAPDGEVVRSSTHVLTRKGVDLTGQVAN